MTLNFFGAHNTALSNWSRFTCRLNDATSVCESPKSQDDNAQLFRMTTKEHYLLTANEHYVIRCNIRLRQFYYVVNEIHFQRLILLKASS
jgi:hypothetical protein